LADAPVLASFALTLSREEWMQLASSAEALARELEQIEHRLCHRPDLWPRLGLPRQLRMAMKMDEPWTPAATRIMRFDFHPTSSGWKISEVNSDVPGGLAEASSFSRLMSAEFPGTDVAGDPLKALSSALACSAQDIGPVALLSAPGHTCDLQVTAGLAAALKEHGLTAILAQPEQIRWQGGRAFLCGAGRQLPLAAIYRFYQGEWLARVPVECWQPMFRGGITPVCNPAAAVLSESKRIPLVWDELALDLPHWRRLLPETRRPEMVLRKGWSEWLLKRAYSNTGEMILGAGWQPAGELFLRTICALAQGHSWVAQKRFSIRQVATPLGLMAPCIGVHVIDGISCGIYGRLSTTALVDYSALDVAILIHDRL
jgi:glutathionylspermidine synthase